MVPLLLVSLGGNAALIGTASACFALPSLPLRPLIGRGVDRGGVRSLYRVASLALVVSQGLFLLPLTVGAMLGRLCQGVAWAFLSTTNNAVMALLAPASRRAEASSYYNMMVGLGYLVGAPIGVLLWTEVGSVAPFVLTIALAGVVVAMVIRVREPARAPQRVTTSGGLFESSAVYPMLMIGAFASAQSLFMVYAPLYVSAVGARTQDLVPHYALYGATLVLAQPLVGRLSDVVGRRRALLAGCAMAMSALLLPVAVPGLASFTVAGVIYGTAFGIVTPAAVAVAIDRSPSDRIGSTVATYSLGYQGANGLGGALWGLLIALVGFPLPLIVAAGLSAVTAILSVRATKGVAGHSRASREAVS